jgi:uncharacterized membrane protein
MLMSRMSIDAVMGGTELPPHYYQYFSVWFALG